MHYITDAPMDIYSFFQSFLTITGEMSPYLLLGFLVAGVLHVYIPKNFYTRYLSSNNKLSVLYAALIGIPLPLCSCGVIPTAIGLKNEHASKGAVASFLIATPQTGIDSILATFSMMGLGFAIIRPTAALVTGICGGLLVNRLVPPEDKTIINTCSTCQEQQGNRLWKVLKYAYFDMMQDIGLRLVIGLLLATLINIAVPDEFFLTFGRQPLLQMLVILAIAVPMYICSTVSIPVAAALMMKGLSPGAALVMLMAGPAVNMASILVVRKSLGRRFTCIYILTIVVFSILFGLLTNALGIGEDIVQTASTTTDCCGAAPHAFTHTGGWLNLRTLCSALLLLFITIALSMKFFSKFKKQENADGSTIYSVEGMHCNHCKAAVEKAVGELKGVTAVDVNLGAKTVTVRGSATANQVKLAVEKAGFEFKGLVDSI